MNEKLLNPEPEKTIPDTTTDLLSVELPVKTRKPRTPKAQAEPEKPVLLLPDDTCILIAGILPFSIMSIFLKKDYEISETQKRELAPMWNIVISKYLPAYLGAYKDETALAVAISLIIIQKSGILDKIQEPVPEPEE